MSKAEIEVRGVATEMTLRIAEFPSTESCVNMATVASANGFLPGPRADG
jgi:hypothetical protein